MRSITKLNEVSGHEVSGYLWPLALTKDPASIGLKISLYHCRDFLFQLFTLGCICSLFNELTSLCFILKRTKTNTPGSVLQLPGPEGHPPSCGHMRHGGQTHSLHASQERRSLAGSRNHLTHSGASGFHTGQDCNTENPHAVSDVH